MENKFKVQIVFIKFLSILNQSTQEINNYPLYIKSSLICTLVEYDKLYEHLYHPIDFKYGFILNIKMRSIANITINK